ncbi:MAG: class I SAM-dependent methyltransferase, partial [Pseudomonadota bacterium]
AKNPDVDDAYAMKSADEVKALYRTWSHSYDTVFSDGQGYQLHAEVAMAFVGAGGAGPVLDVGAGTGLVAEVLQRLNTVPVDGIDLSEDMLAVARNKGIYRSVVAADVTTPLDLQDAPYAGVVSAGTFTLGHVGPEALHHLLAVAAPGALFVISVNAAHFASAGFADVFADLADQITDLTHRDVRIYDDRADEAHRDDIARLMIFRKR